MRDSLFDSSRVATVQKQLIPYAVQDQEMALYNTALEQRGSLSIWFDCSHDDDINIFTTSVIGLRQR